MVHRPADSRLLVNLLNHEKDYLKQLSNLLDQSQTSLASFSAFAAASAPPASQIIISVAGAFAGADEALRKYAFAVEQWQLQLKRLKEAEDEVANIMRDREILVTRLIKASKSQKSTRDSILGASSSSSTLSMKHEVQIGSKLSAAQTELQACEAHLAIKERELDEMRVSTIRTGLQFRCKAMVECGWVWGEMGKEGLRALDMFELNTHQSNGHAYPQHVNDVYSKPLPSTIPDYGSSDHSSLAPSQSASNIIPFDLPFSRPNYLNGQPAMNGGPHSNYTLHIPPAHSISDFTLPNGHAQQAAFEQDQGSSAEEEENIDELEVHENPRFAPKGSSKPKKQQHSRSATDSQVPPQPNMPPSRSEPYVYKAKRELETSKAAQRQRRGSTGVFGSIAALFHSKNHNSSDPDLNSGKWRTRTSKNLTKARHGDDSSDDERPTYNFDDQPVAGPSSSAPVIPDLASSGRLRKRSLKRSSVQPSSSAPRLADVPEDRGWMSDGAGTPNQTPRKKKRPQPISISTEDVSPPKASPKTPKAKAPNGVLSAGLPTEATLSRSSSLSKQSIMSAPATTPTQHTTIHPAVTSKRASLPANPNTNTTRRRTTSLNVDGTKSQNTGNVLSGHGYPPLVNGKGKSRPTANGDPGASLMSIVEDVRKNRDNWEKKQDPNKLLFMAKAPPPVTETHALLDFGQEGHLDINGKAQAHALKLERSLEPIEILNQVDPQPSPPHDKRTVPLRSALRSSRSPSPSTSPPPRPIAGPSTLRPPIIDKRRLSKDSDASSIASFVTVQEDFEDDADESNSPSSTGTPQPISSQLPQLSSLGDDATPRIGFNQPTFIPPAPPPHDPPPIIPPKEPDAQAPIQTNGNSHANGDGQPARRKSVRMALPPTFSATPPAIDEDSEDEKSKHQPWAGRSPPAQTKLMHDSYPPPAPVWSSRIARDRDMWENSSDEDEGEYGTARKMLSVFSKRA